MTNIQIISVNKQSYLIQFTETPQPDILLLDNVITILDHDKNIRNPRRDRTHNSLSDIMDSGFYAPYQNYFTTFSTTIIQILEKLKWSGNNHIIRIEKIYSTPQDPLIYKYYPSLSQYIKETKTILEHAIYQDSIHFKPLADHPELLTIINNLLQTPLNTHDTGILTYFDSMSWVQCNSEHSRHWVFRTPLETGTTLFNMIKSTLHTNDTLDTKDSMNSLNTLDDDNNSIIAFSDNSSAIKGVPTTVITPTTSIDNIPEINNSSGYKYIYKAINDIYHPCLTAETHNYPTYYHPFEGAATGIGGRIRDSLATGRGSVSLASLMGYSVNSLPLLQNASDGASDYANKIGEPCIGGYLRFHPKMEKPILLTAGIGFIKNSHLYNTQEHQPAPGDYLVKVGPTAFKIGFGGSMQSSVVCDTADRDMTAIQRGDPYNGNKVARFLEILATMERPLIKKIHDQGAGGLGNVITELLDGWDADINLEMIIKAPGMSSIEIWLSEFQEQLLFICPPENYPILEKLSCREGILIQHLGTIRDTRTSTIHMKILHPTSRETNTYTYKPDIMLDMHYLNQYSTLLQSITNPITDSNTQPSHTDELDIQCIPSIFKDYHNHEFGNEPGQICREDILERSFKFHLTNKIDRCVGGCVVQQSCIGPFGIPLSNYSITRVSPMASGNGGILSAIGENIYIGQGVELWIDKCVAELISNLVAVPNQDFRRIKLSGNWMTYSKSPECLEILYNGVSRLCSILKGLGMAIDGGKDSLSMVMKTPEGDIISPPSLVLTSYSYVDEDSIQKRISPILKPIHHSQLWAIDILELFNSIPFGDTYKILKIWNDIQSGINENKILALHDGGCINDILEEMAIVSHISIFTTIDLNIKTNSHIIYPDQPDKHNCIYKNHYIIIQISSDQSPFPLTNPYMAGWFQIANIDTTLYHPMINSKPLFNIFNERNKLSLQLDKSTIPYERHPYTPQIYNWPANIVSPSYMHPPESESSNPNCNNPGNPGIPGNPANVKIAIIRDEGSNSHREMAAALMQFPHVICRDYTINELLMMVENKQHEGIVAFMECSGFVFVGGFSYGDVLGSGVATAVIMKTRLGMLFDPIFANPDKFILGVCNGCQILIKYGLFGPNVDITHNKSGKFECRWTSVRYKLPISNVMADLGIWVAHGEGRFILNEEWYNDNEILGQYQSEKYPENPNGSDHNAIGLKRRGMPHYIIMPHPERSIFKWQCEYIPEGLDSRYPGQYTPWAEFFMNLLCHSYQNISLGSHTWNDVFI